MTIRAIALVAVLGAVVAAGTLYATQPAWRNVIAVWLGTSEPIPEAKLASQEWPICRTK